LDDHWLHELEVVNHEHADPAGDANGGPDLADPAVGTNGDPNLAEAANGTHKDTSDANKEIDGDPISSTPLNVRNLQFIYVLVCDINVAGASLYLLWIFETCVLKNCKRNVRFFEQLGCIEF